MGIAYDTKRKLYWAVTNNCDAFAMRLDLKSANPSELTAPVVGKPKPLQTELK